MGFFLDTRLATSAERTAIFQVLAMLRNDGGVVVLLEECQQIILIDVRFIARPTMADTPILAERENPMIAMPMPPDCEDSAAWPLTS